MAFEALELLTESEVSNACMRKTCTQEAENGGRTHAPNKGNACKNETAQKARAANKLTLCSRGTLRQWQWQTYSMTAFNVLFDAKLVRNLIAIFALCARAY